MKKECDANGLEYELLVQESAKERFLREIKGNSYDFGKHLVLLKHKRDSEPQVGAAAPEPQVGAAAPEPQVGAAPDEQVAAPAPDVAASQDPNVGKPLSMLASFVSGLKTSRLLVSLQDGLGGLNRNSISSGLGGLGGLNGISLKNGLGSNVLNRNNDITNNRITLPSLPAIKPISMPSLPAASQLSFNKLSLPMSSDVAPIVQPSWLTKLN